MPATLTLQPQVSQKAKQPDAEHKKVSDLILPEFLPDYESFITEDDTPVDSLISEREMRFLVDTLYASWKDMGKQERPFMACANVGLFYSSFAPAIVPDMFLSLDVTPPKDSKLKENRSYFVWKYHKPPEVVVEIVSNRRGKEDTGKIQTYAAIGIPYYIIHDPRNVLKKGVLRLYELQTGGAYKSVDTNWLSLVNLGITLWHGIYEGMEATWLRWCNKQGQLLLNGQEKADQEHVRAELAARQAEQEHVRAELTARQAEHERLRAEQADMRAEQAARQADQERLRAEQERLRAQQADRKAEQFAAKLRALGIDPDKL